MMGDAAVEYVRAGLALVPIAAGSKAPTTPGWQTRERCVLAEDAARRVNGGNLGLAHAYCMPSPTCALDIDDYDSADVWLRERGIDLGALLAADDAVQIRSGRPGRAKLLYRLPRALATVKPEGSGLELRCASRDGATVQDVLPPSMHPETQQPYTWAGAGSYDAIPTIPAALLVLWRTLIDTPRARTWQRTDDGARIIAGGRNAALTSMAGSMRRRGMSPEAIEAALLAENSTRCEPPLVDDEVRSIARSVARYEPQTSRAGVTPSSPPNDIAWPAPLDLTALARRTPMEPDFILADWLPAGYATLLAGHGGAGKSAIALHLAVCIALGLPFAGIATFRRRVLYLSCEDRERVLHWRLERICRHLGVRMSDLDGWLMMLDLVGHDSVLWMPDRSGAAFTAAYGELDSRMQSTEAQVLCIDGISDTYGGSEISRPEVKRFVNALIALIHPDDGAVLLIGHVAKPTASNAATTEGYSGSTGWHNSARARWYLYPETERDEGSDRPQRTGRLLLELQKSNLGPVDQTIAWRWDAEAHMFLPETAPSHFDRMHLQRDERRGILLALRGCAQRSIVVPFAMQGSRTAYHVLRECPEFPDSMRSGKAAVRRFRREIEHLCQIRVIEEVAYRRPNGHKGSRVMLTPEGERHIATFGETNTTAIWHRRPRRRIATFGRGYIGGGARTRTRGDGDAR
ncbi:MAG: AAA family ATPase [Betaproteobacteria bacterium]|nr:AAA family ATPase [Betaproteobacteria bacterium]